MGVIMSMILVIVVLFVWLILCEKLNGCVFVLIVFVIVGVVMINFVNGSVFGYGMLGDVFGLFIGNLLIFGVVCCELIYVILLCWFM